MSEKVIEKRDSRDRVRYAQPMARTRPRKLGRPPASSSVETRRRILDVARETFADVGWEVTTNKVVAEKANVTSAAIYHYFDSKLEMYRAVYHDAESSVSTEFGAAAAMSDTFVGQFEAILERAYQMNSRDPSLARFLASARVDMKRHPELRGAIRRWAGDEIVSVLVKTGIATGEISAARKKDVSALVRAFLVGLNDAVSDDLTQQRAAIDGVRDLLKGNLFQSPSPNGRKRASAAKK
jgi:AcrR family transcriptional regulator